MYLSLPFIFLKFWFVEAPLAILRYYGSLNTSFLHFSSLLLMIKTFFRPLKNEYREGLVGFSIGMGIVVKTVFIFLDLFLFGLLLAIEALLLIIFILLPFLSLFLLTN